MCSASRAKHNELKSPLIRFENYVWIDKPIDAVFAFVADFRNVPKWSYSVQSVEEETEGSIGLGTRYHQNRRHDRQDFEVTHYVPPSFIAIETLPGSVPAFRMRFRFVETAGSGTMVLNAGEFDAVSHRLLARLLARKARRDAAANLYKLKELLETGAATLQDGRQVTL